MATPSSDPSDQSQADPGDEMARLTAHFLEQQRHVATYRLAMARAHAEASGVSVDIAALSRQHLVDADELAAAFYTGDGGTKAILIVAKALSVAPWWILRGAGDPAWYVESTNQIERPLDPGWRLEFARLNRSRPDRLAEAARRPA